MTGPPIVPDHECGDAPAGPASPPSEGGRRPQSAQLVDLAEARFRLGVSERGDSFGVAVDGPPIARLLRGDRDSLRAELAAAYAGAHGRPPSSQALADALLVLEGRAQRCDREPVALRVARRDGKVILDLGQPDGAAAIVDADGWRIGPSPVLFRRTALTDPLPNPVPGDLVALWALLNVTATDRPLVAAWLVCALLEGTPCPVLALLGEHGTAKTTAGKLLAAVIDTADALRAPPRDLEGWIVAADASRVVGVDNLSKVAGWMSDAICRTVTGEALVRRKLYTDTGISRVAFRRPAILTAIDPGALRGDLADRLLSVELERIPETRRRPDEPLWEAWRDSHPAILGGLLDLTARVLAALPDVTLDTLPRMADFAKVLAAVDQVLGTDGLAAYRGQANRLAADVVDGDAVASAVRSLAESNGGRWEGSAGDLLRRIRPADVGRDWPATPRGLVAALRRCAPALRAVGVAVTKVGQDSRSRRALWRVERSETEDPPAASPHTGERAGGHTRQSQPGKDPSHPSDPSKPANGAGSAAKDPPSREGSILRTLRNPSHHKPRNDADSKGSKHPKDHSAPSSTDGGERVVADVLAGAAGPRERRQPPDPHDANGVLTGGAI